ncbi:MAG: hypothetical protein HY899_19645 [Deltaproteobacteria bacterium]|nr:hypothetical protein [Deltaproteobacteria bacterium]
MVADSKISTRNVDAILDFVFREWIDELHYKRPHYPGLEKGVAREVAATRNGKRWTRSDGSLAEAPEHGRSLRVRADRFRDSLEPRRREEVLRMEGKDRREAFLGGVDAVALDLREVVALFGENEAEDSSRTELMRDQAVKCGRWGRPVHPYPKTPSAHLKKGTGSPFVRLHQLVFREQRKCSTRSLRRTRFVS